MHETTTFELAVLGTVIALASMYSAWVFTGEQMSAFGTVMAAFVLAACVTGGRMRLATVPND